MIYTTPLHVPGAAMAGADGALLARIHTEGTKIVGVEVRCDDEWWPACPKTIGAAAQWLTTDDRGAAYWSEASVSAPIRLVTPRVLADDLLDIANNLLLSDVAASMQITAIAQKVRAMQIERDRMNRALDEIIADRQEELAKARVDMVQLADAIQSGQVVVLRK
jgi:hypothetical protein